MTNFLRMAAIWQSERERDKWDDLWLLNFSSADDDVGAPLLRGFNETITPGGATTTTTTAEWGGTKKKTKI